jgi:uncharacterized Fe-S cluster-containing radical SAM superfamily enzyme
MNFIKGNSSRNRMVAIQYAQLTFSEREGKVRCTLFNRYYFDIALEEFSRVGKVIVHHDSLEFPEASEKKVINKVLPLLEEGLTFHLTHQLYQKAAFYIREELDIPLVGSTEIGVVDRGSNIIEIKPLTGCNFTCTYCSVDEGKKFKELRLPRRERLPRNSCGTSRSRKDRCRV